MDEFELLMIRSYELVKLFTPERLHDYDFPFDGDILYDDEIGNDIMDASEFYKDVHKVDIFYDTPDSVSSIIKGLERYDEFELCSIMADVRDIISDSFATNPKFYNIYDELRGKDIL